jgi:protocatechuate 3,4-dioxygenase beta subunit
MSDRKEAAPTPALSSRRQALGSLSALSALPLVGASAAASAATDTWSEQFSATELAAARTCSLIPTETQGPYPLLSVLQNTAMVRRDITEGHTGVPLTLTLKLVDTANNCQPLSGAAIYIWHCDKDGVYSGYQQPGSDTRGQTFLRGVQLTNAKGIARFTTVYPGWYAGRITHVHFQVYLNNNTSGTVTATSQLAFPQAVTQAVYASTLYAARGQNTSVVDFAHDNVFSDGTSRQMVTVKGSVDAGYQARLLVGVTG